MSEAAEVNVPVASVPVIPYAEVAKRAISAELRVGTGFNLAALAVLIFFLPSLCFGSIAIWLAANEEAWSRTERYRHFLYCPM